MKEVEWRRLEEDNEIWSQTNWQEREEDLVESKLRGDVWKCGTECGGCGQS